MKRPSPWLLPLLLLAACGEKKPEAPPPPPPPPATVEGLAALPAEAHVVVGVNAPRLRGSALVRRAYARSFGDDPQTRSGLEALMTRCAFDPARDLDSVLVGLGARRAAEVVLVARGRFDEAKLVECLRASLAEKGGTLETRTVAGATAYLAARGDSPDRVWLAFGGPDTLILAGEEAWLAKARDPGAPKVKGSPETMALIGKTDTTRGLWGVGTLPPELAGALAGATQGAVTGPVSALYGSVDVDKGLSAEANLVMATDADARGLVEFGGKQLQSLTVMAQSVGLAPVVAKIKLHADGRIARTTIHLDAAELEALEAQLDGSALQPKEGVPQ